MGLFFFLDDAFFDSISEVGEVTSRFMYTF